jgi:hypothetical protein
MLEIKVKDVQMVFDTLDEVLDYIKFKIIEWKNTDETVPLNITVTTVESRAGPAINISVGDKLPTKEALG